MHVKISIITATRNMARFLEPCILSILQQCYPNFEHIVVDGASTDNTREILGRYPHIRWVSEPDDGMSDALNKGIRMSSGEIIGCCNADDLYLPGTLTTVNDYFQQHPDVDLLYGDYRITDETGKSLRVIRETHFSPMVFRWIHVNIVPPPAAFWRRSIHDHGLWFDTKFRYAMDYDFLRRVCAEGYKFKHVNILFSNFRQHGGSLTAKGGQFPEHEFIVRRDANVIWKKMGPAFPAFRLLFLLAVRIIRTAEKCIKGAYFDLFRG